jgi:hypothetical protein
MFGLFFSAGSFKELVRFIPDAQSVADKWVARAGAASGDYLTGAEQTDKDPTALAIAALPRAKTEYVAAIDSGKVAAGLRRSGKAGWLEGIRSKGQMNYQTGVTAARDKVATAFVPLLAFETNLQRQVQSMPANTDAERDQRALTWIRGMRQYQAPA